MFSNFLTDIFGGGQRHSRASGYVPSPVAALGKLVNRARLAGWLPYSAYLPDEHVFVSDNTIGFILEAAPQTGADDEMINVLHSIITACPAGTGIQVILYASPDIHPVMRDYGSLRVADKDPVDPEGRPIRSNNVHRVLARRRAEHYLRGTSKSMVKGFPYLLRTHRLVFALSLPGGTHDVGRLDQLLTLREGMKATLAAGGFPSRTWGAGDLIDWLASFLNPERLAGEPVTRVEYDPHKDIRDQVISPDTVTVVRKDGLSLSKANGDHETSVRLMSVKTYPTEFALWQAGGLVGDLFQVALQYPCPFMIAMGIQIPDQDAMRTMAFAKGARSQQMSESEVAKMMPEWKERAEEWRFVTQSLGEGEFLVRMYHQIALFARPEAAHAAEHATRAIWRARGFELVSDTMMQIQGLLSCMPLSMSPKFVEDLVSMKRISTKLSMSAINCAPMLADWTGTGTPAIVLGGRRGAVMTMDFMDNTQGNYNVAIAGASGSGKSVLMNEVSEAFLGMGRLVRIIDKGRSYKRLCDLLGGVFLDFNEGSNICINPFSMVGDFDEDMEFLKPLFVQMIAPSGYTSRGTPVTDFEKSSVENAIRAVWHARGHDATVSDVAEYLSQCRNPDGNADPRITDMGLMLAPFTASGMYGKWFSGPANVDLTNDLVVLELQSLDGKKELQSVVLFTLIYRVLREMSTLRGVRRGMFMIDEAHALLSGGMAGDFIEGGFRTARKFGWTFATATQGLNDYYKSPGAQASLDNADWLLLLRQKEDAIENVQRAGRLPMNEHMKRMLLSLRTEKGQFSEVFVSSPMGSGVGRLLLDPFSLLLFSSTDDDYAAIRRRQDAGMTLVDAIEDLMRERGLS